MELIFMYFKEVVKWISLKGVILINKIPELELELELNIYIYIYLTFRQYYPRNVDIIDVTLNKYDIV